MKTNKLFEQLIDSIDLSASQMQHIMHSCMKGELTEAQIGAFLALMRMKGETVEELSAAAQVMMDFAHCIDLGPDLIDIVGTGGDGKNTFNISTISSVVAASAGARVAKHGSQSVSSQSGSADVLKRAGFSLDLPDSQLQACMAKNNFCYLFASHFHPAFKKVRNARNQLGIRSFFNLLGPVINPARVTKQVVGVFEKRWQYPLAQVLVSLGSERALVIHSRDGMDEVSIMDSTAVLEYHLGKYSTWSIDPRDYGCHHATLEGVIVDSPAESLGIIESVLDGLPGPARDIVLLNTALALYCAGLVDSYAAGLLKAASAIDSGAARHCFEQLKQFSRGHHD